MTTFTIIIILLVTLIHIYIVILEMFLWTSNRGRVAFGLKSKEFAEQTKVLAANQGLYNGFLVAGFIFALITQDINFAFFFLSCVLIAGFYGAYSTKKLKILYIQSIPAAIGLISLVV